MEQHIYLIGGYHLDTDETSKKIFQLDLRNEKWNIFSEIPRDRTVSCGAVVNAGSLFVVGGHDGITAEFSLSCESLDLETMKWTKIQSVLTEPTFFNGFAAIGDSVFFSGDAVQQVEEVQQLQVDEPAPKFQCSRMHKLQASSDDPQISQFPGLRRTQIPVAVAKNSIVACGGYNEENFAVTETQLLTSDFQWKTVAPMNVPRGSHGLVSSRKTGLVYAIGGTSISGGRHSFRSCEMYSEASNRWTFIKKMSKPRRNFACTNLENDVYVFGGFDGVEGIFFDSEVYDERCGRWRKGPDIPGCLWNYEVAS